MAGNDRRQQGGKRLGRGADRAVFDNQDSPRAVRSKRIDMLPDVRPGQQRRYGATKLLGKLICFVE